MPLPSLPDIHNKLRTPQRLTRSKALETRRAKDANTLGGGETLGYFHSGECTSSFWPNPITNADKHKLTHHLSSPTVGGMCAHREQLNTRRNERRGRVGIGQNFNRPPTVQINRQRSERAKANITERLLTEQALVAVAVRVPPRREQTRNY